jgi:uncharacterized membrane protein
MKWISQPLRLSTAIVFLAGLLAVLVPGLGWLRTLVSLPLVMVLPGYAIVSASDPHRAMRFAERLAISLALSISLAIACGMILATPPLKLSTQGCLLALGTITLVGNSASRRGATGGLFANSARAVTSQ